MMYSGAVHSRLFKNKKNDGPPYFTFKAVQKQFPSKNSFF